MRIKVQQMLRQSYSHSWAVVGLNLAEQFIKLGHDVELIPTDLDKEDRIPAHLQKYVKSSPTGQYDMQLSYTACTNAKAYLQHGHKNRFLIWTYEFRGHNGSNILASEFITSYRYCDKFLSPSHFNKDIFLDGKYPADKIEVVPHGLNLNEFADKETKFPLKTKKRYKICFVAGQVHARKNITGVLESFGRAFTVKDDVALILRVAKNNRANKPFEVNFDNILKDFNRKYPNHAEVEVIGDYIPNMVHLYNAIDTMLTLPFGEGFGLPQLDILGANKLNITSNYSGLKDFLHYDKADETKSNALLVDGVIGRAPREFLYWNANVHATIFKPDLNHAAELLKYSYNNYDSIMKNMLPNIKATAEKYTWDKVAQQILGLCK